MSIDGRIKVESNGPKEEGAKPTAETEFGFDEEALAFNC